MKELRPNTDFEAPESTPRGSGMWGWWGFVSLMGVVFLVCSVFYVWLYNEQVQNGYRLAKLYDEHRLLLTVQRKLHLEWSRFQDPFALEELGQQQFDLAPPREDQKLVTR